MKPFNQINVIPFIDIMLVLLAIVLLTATFISRQQIDLELPAAENTVAANDEKIVTIAIDSQQQFYFDDAPIDENQLAEKLKPLAPSTRIVISVDKLVPFEKFILVIDQLRARKLENLSIMVRDAS